MTAAEAWKKALAEMYDDEGVAEIYAVTADAIDELVFHVVDVLDAGRFKVTVWCYGAKRAVLYRRSETDAMASGIAVSVRLARLSR